MRMRAEEERKLRKPVQRSCNIVIIDGQKWNFDWSNQRFADEDIEIT